MTKRDLLIPGVFALILVAIYLASLDWISSPSLTVKFYGKPVANTSVRFFNTSHDDVLTDASGSVELPNLSDPNAGIFVTLPDGSGSFLHFPQHGNRTVDFQGKRTITHSKVTYFGIITSTDESTIYAYTDDVADAIDAKKLTIEEVQRRIDDEVRERINSED